VRVLAVGNMYPPHHLGGYELVWRSAMGHLRDRGDSVRVLTTGYRRPQPAGPDDPEVHRELRWYWHDHRFPRRSPWGRWSLERHNTAVLERHLEAFRPDAVTWWAMGGMSLSLLARPAHHAIPSVAVVHDDWLLYGPRVDAWMRMFAARPRLGAAVERRTGIATRVEVSGIGRWLFVSDFTRQRALQAGWELAGTEIVPSGIHAEDFAVVPDRPWDWSLLYVGRIDERKGVDTAIDALRDLPPEATLTVVGEGDDDHAAALRERARRHGIEDRVRFAGSRPRSALRDVYADHDALVFPVRWEEPWGLVPLEAMACGRPVVATGRGGSAEYLRDGENCLLFAHDAPRAVAAAIERLAGDPVLRARLREGGLRAAPEHTEERLNERVAAALSAAAARPARR